MSQLNFDILKHYVQLTINSTQNVFWSHFCFVSFQASLVHHLLESYGLLDHVLLLNCDKVNDDVFQGFHSADYIEFLKGDVDVEDESSEEYGLGNKNMVICNENINSSSNII